MVWVWSAVFGISVPSPAHASGDWSWPVVGPVTRAFDPPDSPFGSGHRGIDIAAPVGSAVHAASTGTITFAGPVGGRLFVTVDRGAGPRVDPLVPGLDRGPTRRCRVTRAGDRPLGDGARG